MYIDNNGFARDDRGNLICARCMKPADYVKMSWFNTQMICGTYQKVEESDPRIKQAKEAERQAMRGGNTNFRGIGW